MLVCFDDERTVLPGSDAHRSVEWQVPSVALTLTEQTGGDVVMVRAWIGYAVWITLGVAAIAVVLWSFGAH